jgi:hypothetical protein
MQIQFIQLLLAAVALAVVMQMVRLAQILHFYQ